MIIRVFRATVHDGKHDEFKAFFVDKALPIVQAHPGMLEARIGTPLPSSPNEFLMITIWRDREALEHFAGTNWWEAVIDPDEAPLLRETAVHHYSGA